MIKPKVIKAAFRFLAMLKLEPFALSWANLGKCV